MRALLKWVAYALCACPLLAAFLVVTSAGEIEKRSSAQPSEATGQTVAVTNHGNVFYVTKAQASIANGTWFVLCLIAVPITAIVVGFVFRPVLTARRTP